MTPTERAALEAKAEALFFTVCPHQDRRETARAWHDCPRCVAEFAAAALLSSPPPAEHRANVREDDDLYPLLMVKRPGDDLYHLAPTTKLLGGGLTHDEALRVVVAVRRAYYAAMPVNAIPAAAPAPDEGRPQEKKLTHAASAPHVDLPTKGSDAGCDGKGSLNV